MWWWSRFARPRASIPARGNDVEHGPFGPGCWVKPQKPILNLTHTGDGKAVYRTLARIIVRQAIEEHNGVRPKDPVLRAEAARTERPHISDKRLAKFEVMTAGELARYLGMDVMRIYAH